MTAGPPGWSPPPPPGWQPVTNWSTPPAWPPPYGYQPYWPSPPPPMPPMPLRQRKTGRPAEHSRYHRLGRTDRYRWWKPLLALPLILVSTLVAAVAVIVPMVVVDELLHPGVRVPEGSLLADPLLDIAALLLTVVVVLPAVWLGVRVVEGRSLGWVSSVRGRLRWTWLALTAVPVVPLVVVGFISFIVIGLLVEQPVEPPAGTGPGGSTEWPIVLGGLAIVAVLVPVQAAAEEYFFRGFLMQWIGSYLRNPWPGVAITSVLFALAHADLQWTRLASLTAFGAVAAVLALSTGGLEASIMLHMVNNLVAFGLGALSGVPPTGAISDTTMPWWMVAVDASMLAAVLVAVLLLARRRRIERAVLPPPPPPPPRWPTADPDPLPVGAW